MREIRNNRKTFGRGSKPKTLPKTLTLHIVHFIGGTRRMEKWMRNRQRERVFVKVEVIKSYVGDHFMVSIFMIGAKSTKENREFIS